MFTIITVAVLMDTGPYVSRETCAFLPAEHPCHAYYDPPPPPLCWGPNGWNICE